MTDAATYHAADSHLKESACWLEATPHDLLRVLGAADLVSSTPLPEWAYASLERAPLVVVRRARECHGLIPVGIRGAARNQRVSAWLPSLAAQQQIKPEHISATRAWQSTDELLNSSVRWTLSHVSDLLQNFGFIWGPTGSIAFQLATGIATAVASGDLDILVRVPDRLSTSEAWLIRDSLIRMPVRVDMQVETPFGAVALDEYARAGKTILLRTLDGPRLVSDGWQATAGGIGKV
ncbi:MAG: malonate decarboxylase holo-ACP synthase [Bryobacteraceae bacterium]